MKKFVDEDWGSTQRFLSDDKPWLLPQITANKSILRNVNHWESILNTSLVKATVLQAGTHWCCCVYVSMCLSVSVWVLCVGVCEDEYMLSFRRAKWPLMAPSSLSNALLCAMASLQASLSSCSSCSRAFRRRDSILCFYYLFIFFTTAFAFY